MPKEMSGVRRYRPLRDVRVLSFEAAFSLPAATRVLSELGAEVVRVGRPVGDFPPYTHRTDGSAINKRSVAIDLQNAAGRDLALQLAAQADVVCNNFRPNVMPRLGLGYEALCAARPDLIVLQLSGYGVPGPWQDFPAYGPGVEAAGGMDAAIGGPDDPPLKVGSGVFADQAAGRYAALAVLAALAARRTSGRGRYIDLSMYEGIVHLLGERVLAAAASGSAPPKRGNRSALCAPQGIYPCASSNRDERGCGGSAPAGVADRGSGQRPERPSETSDEWLALSVCDDAQWRGLCDAIGDPALDALRGADINERLAQHDRIDERIAAWTRGRGKAEAAASLAAHGVPAGPVQKASDLPFDPQLRFRGAFQPVVHDEPVLGYRAHPHLTLAWHTEGFDRPPLEDAHPEGADNRAVLSAWLGLSAREQRRLEREGALLPARRVPVPQGQRRFGSPVDEDFAARLGLVPAANPEEAAS